MINCETDRLQNIKIHSLHIKDLSFQLFKNKRNTFDYDNRNSLCYLPSPNPRNYLLNKITSFAKTIIEVA